MKPERHQAADSLQDRGMRMMMPSIDSHFPVTQSPKRSKRPVVSWEGSCRDAAFTERVDTPSPREEWTRDQLRPASGGFRS